ncbi:hypothetical protein BJ138DRAFT_1116423 [Hygrophoropsis aurantiaca]|uniref:Uncharacterized protein n=1 Tax=Hygrophoropsis aurantiaca TaxID=72124 RepID=A0ACB8A3Y0_9AGAM|nr:hypothetical protein BJ138DRAFT_1116423 [Hygrophoropsis aurantiaca]
MKFGIILVAIVASLLFTTVLAGPTKQKPKKTSKLKKLNPFKPKKKAAGQCSSQNFPQRGLHDYRLDVYDVPGCVEREHHEWFIGSFVSVPYDEVFSHCHTLKEPLRENVGSFIFNQGSLGFLQWSAWSEPDCKGKRLDHKWYGDRVLIDATKKDDRLLAKAASFRVDWPIKEKLPWPKKPTNPPKPGTLGKIEELGAEAGDVAEGLVDVAPFI